MATYCSAARLIIAQEHIAIELERLFRNAPLTRSLLLCLHVMCLRSYHIEVMTLRCDRTYIIPAAERMINSPLSHALGSQLVREIGDPIADLSSLVLDRQQERKWTFRAEPQLTAVF